MFANRAMKNSWSFSLYQKSTTNKRKWRSELRFKRARLGGVSIPSFDYPCSFWVHTYELLTTQKLSSCKQSLFVNLMLVGVGVHLGDRFKFGYRRCTSMYIYNNWNCNIEISINKSKSSVMTWCLCSGIHIWHMDLICFKFKALIL